jgi:hypothetical protein
MDTARVDIVLLQQVDVLLRERATELQGDVAAIGNDLLMTRANVTTLETDTAAMRLDVTSLESESDATQADITALQGSVASLQAAPGVDTQPNGWLQFPGTRYRGLSRDEPTGVYLDRDQRFLDGGPSQHPRRGVRELVRGERRPDDMDTHS